MNQEVGVACHEGGSKVHDYGLDDDHYSPTDIHIEDNIVVLEMDSSQEVQAPLWLLNLHHLKLIHNKTSRICLSEVS